MQRAENNYSIYIIVISSHINTKHSVILLKSKHRNIVNIYWKELMYINPPPPCIKAN